MCPLWPLHWIVMYALMLWPLFMFTCAMAGQAADKLTSQDTSAEAIAQKFQVEFFSPGVDIYKDGLGVHMDENRLVNFVTSDLSPDDLQHGEVYVQVQDEHVAEATPKSFLIKSSNGSWGDAFNVSGVFLGKTEVRLRLRNKAALTQDRLTDPLSVTVTRRHRVIDTVFTSSVATLVAIIFINFGCALDWPVVKATIKRPIGPLIGFTSQYIVLPVISFGLAKLLFPNSTAMQLGMFFTGVSPGGGASNIWTYLLGGNLNLSITMTTLSTMAAFGMMPLWIFTLGRQIFHDGNLKVPYDRVSEVAVALIVPVFIGWLIQRYCPRVSKFMVRILKPFSGILIAFIVIFAIITNLYIFRLFTWKIIVAGLGLPWMGYLCGLLLAMLFRQKKEDILAISVETGVHNTGIAIFMLRFALGQPEADLTTVVPVAVAVMTPIPLTMLYIINRFRARWTVQKEHCVLDEERSPVTSNIEPHTIVSIGNGVNNNMKKY